MAFQIKFDISEGGLKSLENAITSIAEKSTTTAKHLQAMGAVVSNAGSAYKKLQEDAKQANESSKKSIKSLEESIKELSGQMGKSAQKAAIENLNMETTYRQMVQSVKGASKGLIASAKEGAQSFTDQSAAMSKLHTEANLLNRAFDKSRTATEMKRIYTEALAMNKALDRSAAAMKKSHVEAIAMNNAFDRSKVAEKMRLIHTEAIHMNRALDKSAASMKKAHIEAVIMNNAFDRSKVAEKMKLIHSQAIYMNNAFDRSAKKMKKAHVEAIVMNNAFDKLKVSGKGAAVGVGKFSNSANRGAQEAAALRAGLNAAGTHMGIFTGQTIVTAGAVYGLVSAFKAMAVTGIDYTGQMARAIPIMGANADQAKMLESEVRRLGETTKFTAVEAAGGLTALAMAGLSSMQAMEALAPALHLASIGQVDMFKSADILTNVMNGFRLSAEEVPNIVDDLATAVTSSNATIEQMATSLSYVAPVATAAGGSIEEVTAILEVFHNSGIKASRAGTSLRRAYSNLLKPSSDAAATLGELGIRTKDSNGYLLEMSDIMKQLANNGAIAADIIEIFGVRAAPAMLALLQDMRGVTSEFDTFRQNLEDNEGAAERLAKKMEDFLGDDLKKLFSALSEQALRFYEESAEGLREMAQGMTNFIRSFSIEDIRSLASNLKTIAETVALVAAGFLALKVVQVGILVLVGAVNLLTSALIAYKASQAAAIAVAIAATSTTTALTVSTTSAAVATTAFGTAIRFALGPLGLILTAVGLAYVAYSSYSEGANTAATAVKKLTDAEKDLAAFKSTGAAVAKSAVKYVTGGGRVGEDRIEQKLNEKIKQLGQKQESFDFARKALVEQWITAPETFGKTTTDKMRAYDEALKFIALQAKDTANEMTRVQGSLEQYLATGLDEQGIRNLKRAKKAKEEFNSVKFSSESALALKQMSTSLQEISGLEKSGQLTAAGALIGTEESIKASAEALKNAYETRILPLLEKQKKFDVELGGVDADVEKWKEVTTKIRQLESAYASAGETIKRALNRSEEGFDSYLSKGEKLKVSSETNIAMMQSQIDKLNGITTATKTATQMKLEHRVAEIGLNMTALEGVEGKETQLAQLKEQLVYLTALIGKTKNLREELEQTKIAAKLKKDFESGKYLAEDDKAQVEYDKGLAQLEAYRAMKGEMQITDEQYTEAKIELDQKLMESQNELWYSMAESMSKTVGDNIAKAAMMDQTWSKTTDNIKKAIIGGLIGTLVQVGVEMAATALLNAIFTKEALVSDQIKATSAELAAGREVTATNSVTVAKMTEGIVSQSGGDPYTAFFRMAAMTAIMAGIQGVVGGIVGGISGGREIGGPVSAGQSYVVGERGAEIFTPTTSGAITSNADVKRGLGGSGGGVTNHYYDQTTNNTTIKAMDSQDVRQALAKESNFLYSLQGKEQHRRGRRS